MAKPAPDRLPVPSAASKLAQRGTVSTAIILRFPGERTATSWIPPSNLSFEDWLACGKAFSEMEGAVQWWIGDWWCCKDKFEYGERAQVAAEGIFGHTFGTLANYGMVARRVETSLRNEVLSFTHHYHVAKLPPAQQRKWLARAVKGEVDDSGNRQIWSEATLRRAIRHAERGIDAAEKFELARTSNLANVIYADPPWKYDNTGLEGAAVDHYPAMTVDEICALAVPEVVADDAALFLWVTNPLLTEGLQVMQAWGFSYKTNFAWIKDRPMISLGFYNRSQHELLLLGTRGSFLPEGAITDLPPSIISAPKAEHSRKPIEAYSLIEGLYGRFIPTMRELFVRGENREGWLPPFGNQAAAA